MSQGRGAVGWCCVWLCAAGAVLAPMAEANSHHRANRKTHRAHHKRRAIPLKLNLGVANAFGTVGVRVDGKTTAGATCACW